MNFNFSLDREIPVLDWTPYLASRVRTMKSSAIRELLKLTEQPDVISFAGGLPAPEFFPLREIEEACRYVVQNEGARALQYSSTEGYLPLREWLATSMHKYGVPAVPNNVLITAGSQQGLDLIGKVFIEPGDYVITERPTYLGAIQAWNTYGARYHTVSLDDDGMVVDEIEEAYRDVMKETGRPPKFIYVLPNFHNPAGVTLSLERREKLAEIATRLNLPIVEDDPYGQLRFEGEDIPPICTFVPERVIYMSTFSKTLTPGLRLGWIVCPEVLMRQFVMAKQGSDLHTGTFVQYIANDICQRGFLKPHAQRLRRVYKERRDTMLDALAEFWPEECSWTRPQGGLFLWARVPDSIHTTEFLRRALEEKVAYVPGENFYPNGDGGFNAMRLNFSFCPPETIVEGIRRLGIALKKALA
ncbi:MAG: PLP-dependent aminotransferase family protein [Chloroflexi bacterium]|jgi:2-aminoadipate transaminase|nr:PLP-dependent aminotransferase family protein [Chloroflexota bacterium]